MNPEEIRSTLEQIKAQVKAKPENAEKTDDEIDEMILESFYKAYTDGKMTKEDLGGLAEAMGYEFTEEFDQDPEAANELNPEQGEGGEPAPAPEAEGATQEDLEAVRTMDEGESAEEFQDKVEEVKEGGHVDEDDDKPNPAPASESEDEGNADGGADDEDDEDEERKKASELWKMNLNK